MQTIHSLRSGFSSVKRQRASIVVLVAACTLLSMFCADCIQASRTIVAAQASEGTTGAPVQMDPAAVTEWYYEGDQKGADFGYAVSSAGDVNGDGYDDILVGAPLYPIDGGKGAVFVFRGPLTEGEFPWTTLSYPEAMRFGCAVGDAGDVNGDGYDDVVVGSCDFKHEYSNEGRAFLFYGSADGLEEEPGWTFDGGQKDAHLGTSVGTAGDVNDDGYDDLVVGVPGYSNGEPVEGGAYMFLGSSSGPITTTHWFVESNHVGAQFGRVVSTAGDVNGDGHSDVLVGAPGFSESDVVQGAVFLYYGSDGGLGTAAGWSASGVQADSGYGTAIGGAGDVNGDGYDDIIAGAPLFDVVEISLGAAFAYYGSPSGPGSTANWAALGRYVGAGFGNAVDTAGDVNGDGYDDVVVGAHLYETPGGERAEGAALVFHGTAGGLRRGAGYTFEGNKADTEFGYSVSTGGDVNGDGFAEVLVGAPEYKHSTDPYGRAYAYYGPIEGPQWQLCYVPLVTHGSP